MHTNDEIKETILKCLYEHVQKSKGPSGIPMGIRDLTSAVKSKIDVKQQVVSSNLHSLIKNGFVDEKEVQNPYAAAKFNSKPAVKYELSRAGISYFDQGSKFDLADRNTGINIQMLNSAVVIGNQNIVKNIVREEYKEGYLKLEELGKRVNLSSDIKNEDKVNLQADIETIKNQLAKVSPNHNIVKAALASLSGLADISQLSSHYESVKNWILSILGFS
ncbi:MAG: hypothetical protein UX99_C0016G0004 [Candidatus Amesbacteria bacterium GW2011_GWB1_47_26]|uniref:Uncharacterized protein n=1 Tax=Candidatus Amesbacteria bacterium GW2011_GWC2_45_19 TaxID=1618366 RepID=A0A0G1M4Y0_9BACT|nr:MAG: hypothetical protein UX05_C0002G0060 [Candidatus Amesbacteria bacterium GW2011_GWC2_45_19]KKU37574.1 MAG: hypothetical protein UX52_C0022G0010 [Candidatus Amesbacteria bacterium GW2011_GWA1_46_35]KKU68933.1 MAG: hypothetical protein UX93_C0004G0004 [Microgenomates group bacterium GW2011_GWC1_47_20]KKU74364.1 MAG: hypothetical protein UX99_C0016G0004 [Candidatus Amesbacteria bacterium GW2011_GWB1_47_26]KKU80046.1 MAG: hypothetical protein UY06_C0007G0021 [Candidatus Amesbacteria bacteriu